MSSNAVLPSALPRTLNATLCPRYGINATPDPLHPSAYQIPSRWPMPARSLRVIATLPVQQWLTRVSANDGKIARSVDDESIRLAPDRVHRRPPGDDRACLARPFQQSAMEQRRMHATMRMEQQAALIAVGRDLVLHIGFRQHIDRHREIALQRI